MSRYSKRPSLTPLTPVNDFLDYYWLKQELVDFCRAHQLKTTGSKVAITARIAQWLRTGQPPLEPIKSKRKPGSAGPLFGRFGCSHHDPLLQLQRCPGFLYIGDWPPLSLYGRADEVL